MNKAGIFTYHLVHVPLLSGLRYFLFSNRLQNIPGLIHGELMTSMTLGSPIFSSSRILVKQMAFFAQWESENHLELFLAATESGKLFSKGWHVRLRFLRKWGKISGFKTEHLSLPGEYNDSPVVAVTLARMRFFQIPRFIHWGRPVEKLVRDHPGTIFSSASLKLPNLVSTFSIWKTTQEMKDMVHGHSAVSDPHRHNDAMKERERKDFHYEFTTLRFQPVTESGTWQGRKLLNENMT